MCKEQIVRSQLTYYPLTHPQKRVWYTEQLYKESSAFNIGGSILFDGKIDLSILRTAIKRTVEQNESIFTQLQVRDGEPCQYISIDRSFQLELFDFSREEDPWYAYHNWVKKKSSTTFDLLDTTLFFIALFKVDETHMGYFLHFHHIIADGWSIHLFTEQVREHYFLLEGADKKIPSSIKKPLYTSYLKEELEYLKSPRFQKNAEFWRSKYEAIPDFSGVLGKSIDTSSKRKTLRLDKSTSRAIRLWCKQNQLSVPTLFTALYTLLLRAFFQKNDIVIGMPILNRNKSTKDVFGMFISTIPIRIIVDPKETVIDFMHQVAREVKTCLIHQKYPYDLLVSQLELRRRDLEGLFDFSFNYYNSNMVNRYKNIRVSNNEYHSGEQIYAMQMLVHEWSDDDTISISFDYKRSFFDDVMINSFFDCTRALISQTLSKKEGTVGELSLLSNTKRAELVKYYNYTDIPAPQSKTVIDLFEEQVKATPNSIAISHGEQALSYKELSKRINQFACLLKKQNLVHNTIVAISADHSIELIIAIFSSLKAGYTFLPIDKSYPAKRIKYMIEDAKVQLLITDDIAGANKFYNGTVIDIHSDVSCYGSDRLFPKTIGAEDNAYVIFTSGSTGKPKGVIVEHGNLLNYALHAKNTYIRSTKDVFAFYSSISFDLTITSMIAPLISGIECRVFAKKSSQYILSNIVKEKKATILKLTPSHLQLMQDFDFEGTSLNTLILGGEQLPTDLANKICSKIESVRLFNEYGPTEATVGCMIHEFDAAIDIDHAVPIGIPIANTQLYVLNSEMKPVPEGAYGELYISGAGVAKGYLNKEGLTKERFLTNPFRKDSKMYKTGDIVRFKDGVLVFKSRNDEQIKINGYRIERGEIETEINRIKGVRNSVVTICRNSDRFLCAFIESHKKIRTDYIENKLRKILPTYMIPSYFSVVSKIPLTPGGKIDYDLLPYPEQIITLSTDHEDRTFDLSNLCLKTIKDILLLDQVSVDDNFFMLGGDSISAIQLSHSLKSKNIDISVADILQNPRIKDMVAVMQVKNTSICQARPTGMIEPTPMTNWFFMHNHKQPGYYHQSIALDIPDKVDQEILAKAFKKLIEHQDTLRLFYDSHQKRLRYDETFHRTFRLNIHHIRDISEDDWLREIKRIATEEKESIVLGKSPLFKAVLFSMKARDKLLLIAHHLIIDAVSWSIVIKDLATIVDALIKESPLDLGPGGTSLKAWSQNLYHQKVKDFIEEQTSYWNHRDEVTMSHKTIKSPMKYISTRKNCIAESITLNADLTQNIIKNAHASYHTKNDELLKIAFAMTLADFHNQDTVVYHSESHGRNQMMESIDITSSIGWFTALYPTVFNIKDCNDVAGSINEAKNTIRSIPYGGVGYGILKYLYQEPEYIKPNYIFNYLGDFDQLLSNDVFELSFIDHGKDVSPENYFFNIMEMNVMIINKKMIIQCLFNPSFFKQGEDKVFLRTFEKKVNQIVSHCIHKNDCDVSVMDFDSVELSEQELDILLK